MKRTTPLVSAAGGVARRFVLTLYTRACSLDRSPCDNALLTGVASPIRGPVVELAPGVLKSPGRWIGTLRGPLALADIPHWPIRTGPYSSVAGSHGGCCTSNQPADMLDAPAAEQSHSREQGGLDACG